MSKFYSLTVSSLKSLTNDSVAISFDTLDNELFQFIPGQYITINHQINGEQIRRAYSICSMTNEGITIGAFDLGFGEAADFAANYHGLEEGKTRWEYKDAGDRALHGFKMGMGFISAKTGVFFRIPI